MRKIPLTTYLQEVQSLIDNGEIETALTQLRQVLEQYPHHLQTYQLVGQALLKSGSVGTAEEFFQRVLSALPNDQFAHSGMATASEQQGKLDEALWHATRAYEQQPSNDTLRKTFFSLQHKRNGMQVDRLRLTRGTLARLYLRGGIYPQAIAEVQAALKEEPARPDLQTLLLECWWEAGNQEESRQLAQQILQDYPNNMLANRVMAKLAPETDKAEYLEKVQRMNPLLGEIGTPESSETCWLDLSGEESEFLSQQSESQMPANEAVEDTFLNDIFAQASVSPAPAVEAPAPSPDNHLPALSLPDWMLNETPTDAETPAITPDAPKVETSVDGAPERIDGELTEWLANPPSEVLTPAKSAVTQESVVEPSEIPDWLGEILSGTPEIRPDEAIASAEAQAMTPHEVSAPAEPALELQAPEELPDDDEVIPVLLPVSPEPDRAQAGDQSATALPTLDLAAIFGAVPEQPHVSEATSDTLSDDSLERTLYELSQLETQPVSVKRESPAEPLAETPMTEVVDFAGALVSDETIIEGTVAAKDMPQTALPDNAETELPPVAELPIAAETTPVSEPATGEANFIETDFYEASLPVRPDTDLPTDEKSAREFLETLFDTADSAEPAPIEDELFSTAPTEATDGLEALVGDETIIEGKVVTEDMPPVAPSDNAETELPPMAEMPVAAETAPVSEPAAGEANFIETDFYEASLPVRPDTDLPTDEKSAREFLETLFDTADSAEPAPVEDELILPAVAELPSEALAEIPNLPAETRLADDIEVNDLAFLLEEPHAETPTANAGNDSGETLNISEQQTKPLAGLEEFPVLPTPDWEAIEAHANQQAKETPDWLSNVVSAPEENALVDDIEWLPELSESQELRATATNLQGTDRHVVANEPDWLSSAKEALLPDAKNLEIPDWLHEAMASGENTPEDSLNPLADISATPATEEIPDWLQNVTKVADADEPSAKLDTALEKTFQKVSIPSEPIINEAISELEAPLEPEPDWLKPTFTESQSVDALQASPDWLPAEPMPLDSDKIEAELADIEPPTSTLNDGMEGWLNDLLPEEAENQPVQDEIPTVKPANRPHQVSPAERIDNFDEWLKNAIGVGEDTQGQPAVARAETPESAVMAELNQLSANSDPAEEASTEPAPIDDWFMRLPEAMGVEVETPMASESPVTAEAPTLPEAQLVPEVAETVEVSAVAEISAPSLPSDEVKPQENIESHLREHAMLPQVDAWKPKTANLPADHLAQARESLLDGLIPQAIQRYGKLVRGGKLIPSVIEDLQVAVKEQPRKHRAELYQVLGDALSKAERLDEALEAYKQALQQL